MLAAVKGYYDGNQKVETRAEKRRRLVDADAFVIPTGRTAEEIDGHIDAVISCCATRNHIDYIATRNIKDYEKSKVQAVLPEQLLKLVSQDDV